MVPVTRGSGAAVTLLTHYWSDRFAIKVDTWQSMEAPTYECGITDRWLKLTEFRVGRGTKVVLDSHHKMDGEGAACLTEDRACICSLPSSGWQAGKSPRHVVVCVSRRGEPHRRGIWLVCHVSVPSQSHTNSITFQAAKSSLV